MKPCRMSLTTCGPAGAHKQPLKTGRKTAVWELPLSKWKRSGERRACLTEAWQVILSREPKKILDKVPADLRRRILARLHELESDARPTGPKKLTGYTDLYRIRVGDWRVTY